MMPRMSCMLLCVGPKSTVSLKVYMGLCPACSAYAQQHTTQEFSRAFAKCECLASCRVLLQTRLQCTCPTLKVYMGVVPSLRTPTCSVIHRKA
jgi:hypothetical protein